MAKKFSVYLADLIAARATSVQEISRRTRMSRTTIDRHLNDDTVPEPTLRDRYAAAFGFASMDEFDRGWLEGVSDVDLTRWREKAVQAGRSLQAVLDDALQDRAPAPTLVAAMRRSAADGRLFMPTRIAELDGLPLDRLAMVLAKVWTGTSDVQRKALLADAKGPGGIEDDRRAAKVVQIKKG